MAGGTLGFSLDNDLIVNARDSKLLRLPNYCIDWGSCKRGSIKGEKSGQSLLINYQNNNQHGVKDQSSTEERTLGRGIRLGFGLS